MVTDRETGKRRGFAFVTFNTKESAEKAFNEMSGFELKGMAIRVDWSTPRGARPAQSYDNNG